MGGNFGWSKIFVKVSCTAILDIKEMFASRATWILCQFWKRLHSIMLYSIFYTKWYFLDFLCDNAKVASLKEIITPHLKLLSSVLLTNLNKKYTKCFRKHLSCSKYMFISDKELGQVVETMASNRVDLIGSVFWISMSRVTYPQIWIRQICPPAIGILKFRRNINYTSGFQNFCEMISETDPLKILMRQKKNVNLIFAHLVLLEWVISGDDLVVAERLWLLRAPSIMKFEPGMYF